VIDHETEMELIARRLEGETLARVHYVDAWPGVDRTSGDHGDDTVGIAVCLALASGRVLEVRWADELGLRHGFGIGLRELRVPDGDRGRLEDVTPRWGALVGTPITRATVQWGLVRNDLRSTFQIGLAICADHLTRADYPRALELTFGVRRVAIDCMFTSSLVVRFGAGRPTALR
jgi:hypothetical protein